MADNVTLPGTGAAVATDDVAVNGGSTAQVQYVKVVDGTANGTEGLPGSAARGLTVDNRFKVTTIAVTPTVSSGSAYAVKDAVGALYTFANAARASGGSGRVEKVSIVDKGQQMVALDVVFFKATFTAPTDNAVFDPTDAELGDFIGHVSIYSGDYADFNDNSVATKLCDLPFSLTGTDLFAAVVARGTPTYTSTSDLIVTLHVVQD